MNPKELRSNLADVDRLIHEPARLMILSILYVVESADFLYLQNETGLSKVNLSSHLSKLEQAGYIAIEKTYRGKIPLTLCRITTEGSAAFTAYRRQWKNVISKWE
jgi:DNA-binding transcriptional ArsR family regulator